MPQDNDNPLATLAQLMQLSHAVSQPQQQQQEGQMKMALQALALQQGQEQHRAEQEYKQQALAQSQQQFDASLGLHNQQEAASALNVLERQGPLKLDPYTLALVEQAYPQHAGAIKEGMFHEQAAKLMAHPQELYDTYNKKPDINLLRQGLIAYLPTIWNKQHPAVQAKMGEMFDALNQGMTAPPPISNTAAASEFVPTGWNGAPVTQPLSAGAELGQKVRTNALSTLFPVMNMATAQPRDLSGISDFFGALVPQEARPQGLGLAELLKAFRSQQTGQ